MGINVPVGNRLAGGAGGSEPSVSGEVWLKENGRKNVDDLSRRTPLEFLERMSSLSVRCDFRSQPEFRCRENAAGLTTFRPPPGDPPARRSKLPLSGMQQLVEAALPKVVAEDATRLTPKVKPT